jgi:hypothetical protein
MNFLTTVFVLFESFIAFLIATSIIIAASYVFPFYLIPLILVIMGIFMYYVYGQRDKGTTFLALIYTLTCLLACFLIWLGILKFFYRKKMAKSSFFFAQKSIVYHEYTF